MNPPPFPGTKESRIAVAKGRIEFWTIWSTEAVSPEAKEYFLSRKNHWIHVAKAIDLEA